MRESNEKHWINDAILLTLATLLMAAVSLAVSND